MKELCIFLLVVIFARSGLSHELVGELLTKTTPVSVEIDDDNNIDFTNTKEVRIELRNIINNAIDDSDPLFVKRVTANLDTLNYTVTNVNVLHIAKCTLLSYTMNLDFMKLNMHMRCPQLVFFGKYEISGTLIVMPIEGSGHFVIDAENYDLFIDTKLKHITNKKKGINHMKIQNFTLDIGAGGPVEYKLLNLFHGNETLSAEAHKFAYSNWRSVAQLVQDPFLNAVMKVFLKNTNKLLKAVPIKDIEY